MPVASQRSRSQLPVIALVLIAVIGVVFGTPSFASGVAYSGRLTRADGAPVERATLTLKIFASEADTVVLKTVGPLVDHALTQGVFTVDLGLTAADLTTLFSADGDVWIELTADFSDQGAARQVTLPRQRMLPASYALRTRIDDDTLYYDTTGA